MTSKFKLILPLFFMLDFGCSRQNAEPEPRILYEGVASKVDYHLMEGKTVVTDDQGRKYDIEGFPMLFLRKVKVLENPAHGYDVEIVPLSEEEKAALIPPAEPTQAPAASEYE